MNGLQDQALIEDRAATLKDLNDLNADADSLGKLTHETLLQSALKLYDEEHCPVCDTEWKPEAFKEIVNQKLQKLAAVKEKKENLEKKISPIALSFESLAASLNTVAKYAMLFRYLQPLPAHL